MGKGKNHGRRREKSNKFKLFGFTQTQYLRFQKYQKENTDLIVDESYSNTTNTIYLMIKVHDLTMYIRISDHNQYQKKYDYEITPYNGNHIKHLLEAVEEIRNITRNKTA